MDIKTRVLYLDFDRTPSTEYKGSLSEAFEYAHKIAARVTEPPIVIFWDTSKNKWDLTLVEKDKKQTKLL